MWVAVQVPCRADDLEIPVRMAPGFTPFAGAPLAVTTAATYDAIVGAWVPWSPTAWQIVHVSTGFTIGGGRTWPTREEAESVLMRCDPHYAAWPLALGRDDPATIACRMMFRKATEEVA